MDNIQIQTMTSKQLKSLYDSIEEDLCDAWRYFSPIGEYISSNRDIDEDEIADVAEALEKTVVSVQYLHNSIVRQLRKE